VKREEYCPVLGTDVIAEELSGPVADS
jgi:hypothetical protein